MVSLDNGTARVSPEQIFRAFADGKLTSAIFITFSGNCRKALSYYQSCFGGILQFETFEKELQGYTEMPVVIGSLIAESIVIYGSDLVHNEGRTIGNYLAVFLHCKDAADRHDLIEKLQFGGTAPPPVQNHEQKLVELTDAFDVRWVLAI